MKALLKSLLKSKKRRVGAAILCLALALVAVFVLTRKSGSTLVAPVPLSGTLSVSAPSEVQAGQAISVTISAASAIDGTPARLLAENSFGPKVFSASFSGGKASFALPSTDTQQAGVLNLIALAGNATGNGTMTIKAGPPVEPVTPLVGGRSIIADAAHWSMVVVVPIDQYGNPVIDGTPVQVRASHPVDNLEAFTLQVQHLLAWTRLYSKTTAGRTLVSVEVAGKSGPEADLSEVAGWPVPFALSSSPVTLPADGRQLMTLKTEIIVDKFGNTMPDGTLIIFVVLAPDGTRREIPAETIGGVAQAPLQAATAPGTFDVHATIYGVESKDLKVAFTDGPAVSNFPLRAKADAANQAIVLTAGPILGSLGQYVPDGTLVTFKVVDTQGNPQYATSITAKGYATLSLRVAVLILGTYTAQATAGSGQASITFQVP